MNYIEFTVTVNSPTECDVAIALLGDMGFESFTEQEDKLFAYIPETEHMQLEQLFLDVCNVFSEINFQNNISYKIIEQQNWNSTWEKSFEPILVADKCIIRAPFHAAQSNILNIVIEPKMSFGTGHHQTTFLMLETMFELELYSKTILDMGCGTAVLAIVAEKLNAKKIVAIDIEDWAFENAIENVALNECSKIEVIKGGAEQIGTQKFDIIIANINKNVLMNDLNVYANALQSNGILLLSGFFSNDTLELISKANAHNLKHSCTKKKDEWAMLKFEKN